MKNKSSDKNVLVYVDPAQYYGDKGHKLFERGQYHQAGKYLRKAYQLNEAHHIVHLQLAITLSFTHQYQASNELFFKLLEFNYEPAMCHFYIGRNYVKLGQYHKAIDHLLLFTDVCDEDSDLLMEAEELIALIQLDGLDDTLLEYEDHMLGQLEKGTQLMQENHLSQAISVFQALVGVYKYFWPAHNNLALCYLQLGQDEKALENFQEIIEYNPENQYALGHVFSIYKKFGNELKAFETIDKLMKIRPTSVQDAINLATVLDIAQEYKVIYKWFKYCESQLESNEYQYFFWYARAAYYTGHREKAEALYRKIVRNFPELADTIPWEFELTEQFTD